MNFDLPSAGGSSQLLLTRRQLATLLHVSVQTLERWALQGDGPPYIRLCGKKGRVVYRLSDVSAWLDSRRRNSTSE